MSLLRGCFRRVRAVQMNVSSDIGFLASQGVDINEADTRGRTALMTAVQYGKFEAVEMLVSKGRT